MKIRFYKNIDLSLQNTQKIIMISLKTVILMTIHYYSFNGTDLVPQKGQRGVVGCDDDVHNKHTDTIKVS